MLDHSQRGVPVTTSATDIIAEVLRKHRPSIDPETSTEPYHCGDDNSTCWDRAIHPWWRLHVATEINRALGKLTRDCRRVNPRTRSKPCDNCGHIKGIHAEPCHIGIDEHTECGCPRHVYNPPETTWECRWVGGWTPDA